jgi:hypothetical protein
MSNIVLVRGNNNHEVSALTPVKFDEQINTVVPEGPSFTMVHPEHEDITLDGAHMICKVVQTDNLTGLIREVLD